MDVIETLRWITDKNEGLGMPLSTVAKQARCTPGSLSNYLSGYSQPNPSIEMCLELAFKNLKNMMNEKIKD